jgi:hypothetical protein
MVPEMEERGKIKLAAKSRGYKRVCSENLPVEPSRLDGLFTHFLKPIL